MDIFESWLINNAITRFGLVTTTEPENSVGAINNSINIKAPIMLAVESLDDENLICFPYKNISKLTDGTGYVQTLNINDIKDLRLKNTEYKILTLEEALKVIDGKVPVLIYILNDSNVGKMESNVYKVLKEYNGEYAIVCSNPYVLEWFKNNAPDVWRGIKSGKFPDKLYGSLKSKRLTKLKYNKIAEPDFIVYNAEDLPNKYVKKYSVLPIIAYNVTNEHDYLNVVKYCDYVIVDGFISDL